MTLKQELNAERGSFLLELRNELSWNNESFVNLLIEMEKECKRTKDDSTLARDIASGIWYISHFVKDWTTHENFPKRYSTEFYQKAYEVLSDLGYYYFMGQSPYEAENEMAVKIESFKNASQYEL